MKYRSREIKDIYYYDGNVKNFLDYFRDEISSYRIFTQEDKNSNMEIWSKNSSTSKSIYKGLYISHNRFGFQTYNEEVMKDWEALEC